MALFEFMPHFSTSTTIVLAPFLATACLLTAVRVYTTIRYRLAIQHQTPPTRSTKVRAPPPVPYTIPILGHAISFLAPRPGQFWAQLFRSHPHTTGACTLNLGGKANHILFSPSAVQALFKARGPGRDGFNLQIVNKAFGLDLKECLRYFGIGEGPDHTGVTPVQQQDNFHHHYMLEKKAVNELTANFMRVLNDQITHASKAERKEEEEVGLYAWLQDRMFTASTTALMGSRMLEVYPNLREDFFIFDRELLTMFFGVPKWLSPTPYRVREKALDALIEWQRRTQEECKGDPADPAGDIDWEPVYGSRVNRARQRYYASRGLSVRTRAGMDLGFLFGLNSNAIPATGWMLLHILNDESERSLLSRVMEELETTKRDDGTIDIATLIALPLLQSIFHEVLRLYVDVLVTRELKEDLTLPLDDGQRQILLGKDTVVMAPSWLGHRDEALWTNPPSLQFHAERFLKTDPETGKQVFTTSGTNGKFFPFGGGKTICPGRVFAKQEILGSVATVLMAFQIEPLGFLDDQGKSRKEFPGLAKAYSGSGVMVMDGDMKVKICSRKVQGRLN